MSIIWWTGRGVFVMFVLNLQLVLLLAALPRAGVLCAVDGVPELAAQQDQAVMGAIGQDAVLRCTVLRLGDKTVSWVRVLDLQILTHAGSVFTADSRVSASVRSGPGRTTHHELRISRLRSDDAGRYECQLNTEPKTSLLFNLTVFEGAAPRAVVRPVLSRVFGAAGGAATLACSAQYEPAPPSGLEMPSLQIRWTHAGEPLDATTGRGGVSLEAERWSGGAKSALTLADLRLSDAGPYVCNVGEGTKSARAQIQLRVRDKGGGAAEAMQGDAAQTDNAGNHKVCGFLLWLCSWLALGKVAS